MNLQQLYYFREVAQVGSYTEAAKRLFLAQSSLSHSIASLERELGVPLFHKIGRGIQLTPYGKTFLEYAKRALNELDTGTETIRTMLNPYAGTIRLALSNALTFQFIPSLIQKFHANPMHHEIQFQFAELQAHMIEERIKKKEADLGFGAYFQSDDMEFFPIIEEKLMLVVSRSHPLANRKQVPIRELEGLKLVTFTSNCVSRTCIDELLQAQQIDMDIAYEAESEAMITTIVASNLGVALLPQTLFSSAYDICQLDLDITPYRRLYLVWHKYDYMHPVVRLFRDFVLKTIPLPDKP